MNSAQLLREFLAKPASVGAIAPSSAFLAEAMLQGLSLDQARAVAEYGPGTGIFTEFILRELPPDRKFFAIEVNPRLVALFKKRYPQTPIFQDSVANVRKLCDSMGITELDTIVSGLPWAAFTQETQTMFLDQMMKALKPGGRFVTFAYLHGLLLPPAQRFAELLPEYFSSVTKSEIVWLNLPPAFVYRCVR